MNLMHLFSEWSPGAIEDRTLLLKEFVEYVNKLKINMRNQSSAPTL